MDSGHRAALEHILCQRYKKECIAINSNYCISRLRPDNMNAQDEDFVLACLLGKLVHSASAAVPETEGRSAAGGKKADEKSKVHVGARMVIGRHRRYSRWATTQRSTSHKRQMPGIHMLPV